MPTSLAVCHGRFYILEGNRSQLLEVTLDGVIRQVADFSARLGHRAFTALELGPGNHFIVGSFGEVPYPNGSARLWRVSKRGVPTEIADGLTNVIDIRRDGGHRVYILESSTGNTSVPPFLVPGSGRVVVATGDVGCMTQLSLGSSTPVVHTARLGHGRTGAACAPELRRAHGVEQRRIHCEAQRVIDPKQLLDQVLGGGMANDIRSAGRQMKNRLDQTSGTQAFAGGAVAGGLLGLLLGGKKVRKMAGGALGYGGAAVIGALALRAYQSYQQQQAGRPAAPARLDPAPLALPHVQPAVDGSPFELVLVRAMVGAAKADGHIDAKEQKRLFAEVERLGLDAEAKAYVFDLLTKDVDLPSLTTAVATPEQGAELYLAARLAIDPDEPAERAYLDALASRLRLPAELREQLDRAPQETPT